MTEGAAAATSAMDRCIPAAEGPTGDGTIPRGRSGAGTVAATFTRGQQDHLVVPSSSSGPLQQQWYRVTPAVTRSRSIAQPSEVSRTFRLLAAEEGIARTLAQPDAAFSTRRSSQRASHACWRHRRRINKRTWGRTTASGQRRSAWRWRGFRRSGPSWRKGECSER